jgi:hypothetical protein
VTSLVVRCAGRSKVRTGRSEGAKAEMANAVPATLLGPRELPGVPRVRYCLPPDVNRCRQLGAGSSRCGFLNRATSTRSVNSLPCDQPKVRPRLAGLRRTAASAAIITSPMTSNSKPGNQRGLIAGHEGTRRGAGYAPFCVGLLSLRSTKSGDRVGKGCNTAFQSIAVSYSRKR